MSESIVVLRPLLTIDGGFVSLTMELLSKEVSNNCLDADGDDMKEDDMVVVVRKLTSFSLSSPITNGSISSPRPKGSNGSSIAVLSLSLLILLTIAIAIAIANQTTALNTSCSAASSNVALVFEI